MSLRHAILGFLSFQPCSGYDLKRAFDSSVQHFWPANQSQIYRTMAELDEQGYVEKEVVARKERLDMKVYRITDAGREELRRWLRTPQPPQDNREPLLIQVYFGGHLTDSELLHVLKHTRDEACERIRVYTAIYETVMSQPRSIDDPRAVFLATLTLEYGLIGARALLPWLDSAIERIRAGDYTLKSLSQLIGAAS